MKSVQPLDRIGSRIPIDGMYIKRESNQGSESNWNLVFGDEARKVNPLFDVKVKRDELILSSIANEDWSDYNEFEAKQHPAWYEQVNGQYQPNKVYYGNLIESKIGALKEAQAKNDLEGIETWTKSLEEAIADFNRAPGIVPYVVGLNHTAEIAAANGVAEPSDEYFDSKWNSPLAASQGKFAQNMWYDNAYFAENQQLKEHIETLVAGSFPTSTDSAATVVAESKEDSIQSIITEQQENSESSLQDISFQNVLLHNLKFAYKPSLNLVEELYK
ncbi:hypothetical protein D1B33_03710 [Lysinibacillus yapensis]|uniref:Uncharacterized protein n=1 Tax=Ureibacillus yapensis TaxID=2304605 RepID=A0A396SE25_9BACL|nr:hypothetical protein [Lysinibacillus yapensis]RHW39963.1 hypothetical protein D1B33_03710 [Lysinibacillus yapensis]